MIGSAMQKDSYIYVYDERGNTLYTKPGDALVGYTGSTVTIRIGSYLYTYDERGNTQYTKSV